MVHSFILKVCVLVDRVLTGMMLRPLTLMVDWLSKRSATAVVPSELCPPTNPRIGDSRWPFSGAACSGMLVISTSVVPRYAPVIRVAPVRLGSRKSAMGLKWPLLLSQTVRRRAK